MILPVRYLVRPKTSGLTDVLMTIYDDLNAVISVHTLSEILSTGVYGVNVTLVPSIYSWASIESITAGLHDIIRLTPSTVSVSADISYLIQAETGTWKRIGSTLSYYDLNMILIAQYQLQDSNGNPTVDPTSVANRVRIGP